MVKSSIETESITASDIVNEALEDNILSGLCGKEFYDNKRNKYIYLGIANGHFKFKKNKRDIVSLEYSQLKNLHYDLSMKDMPGDLFGRYF